MSITIRDRMEKEKVKSGCGSSMVVGKGKWGKREKGERRNGRR